MKKNLIERIKAKTPHRDKAIGRITTVAGTACATVLALGLVSNPVGITLLTVGVITFGGKSLYHAQKTLK